MKTEKIMAFYIQRTHFKGELAGGADRINPVINKAYCYEAA